MNVHKVIIVIVNLKDVRNRWRSMKHVKGTMSVLIQHFVTQQIKNAKLVRLKILYALRIENAILTIIAIRNVP